MLKHIWAYELFEDKNSNSLHKIFKNYNGNNKRGHIGRTSSGILQYNVIVKLLSNACHLCVQHVTYYYGSSERTYDVSDVVDYVAKLFGIYQFAVGKCIYESVIQ